MRKKIVFLLLCTVPALVFLNIWEVFRFEDLKKSVAVLEQQQKEWLEKNKRIIAGIAVLSSPARIDMLAREELELQKLESGKLIRIEVNEKKKP